ncbi:MAG: hypothetical protein RIQ93_3147 [Verrucomicrobiota bacterium]
MRPDPASWRELSAAYQPRARSALSDSILPFWWRTIDGQNGGVFNCWNNSGTHLVSRDKFTWSQGRFAWLWSRLAEVTARGVLPGNSDQFAAQAGKTVRFLENHAFLEDGRCAFVLSESGAIKELNPTVGKAPSIYADCFVVMGFAGFAEISGDRAVLDSAWRLFENIERRLQRGGFPTHPDPIPEGHASHAIAMIYLNVALVLHAACERLADHRAAEAWARAIAAAARIFDTFVLPGGRVAELRPPTGASDDTLLCRHINPGHALEGLWMLMTVAAREKRADWMARTREATRFALERGWDDVHGGILHYVDADGGPPRGVTGDSIYEASVRRTWDTKLWWVHSEALYASLLCYAQTGDATMRSWFERLWEYSFRVFPQSDPAIGEWIQIRDRQGEPLDQVVALPVKDPYHIARNLIQILELCSTDLPTSSP